MCVIREDWLFGSYEHRYAVLCGLSLVRGHAQTAVDARSRCIILALSLSLYICEVQEGEGDSWSLTWLEETDAGDGFTGIFRELLTTHTYIFHSCVSPTKSSLPGARSATRYQFMVVHGRYICTPHTWMWINIPGPRLQSTLSTPQSLQPSRPISQARCRRSANNLQSHADPPQSCHTDVIQDKIARSCDEQIASHRAAYLVTSYSDLVDQRLPTCKGF